MGDAAWNREEARKTFKALYETINLLQAEIKKPHTYTMDEIQKAFMGIGMLGGKILAVIDILRSGRE